MTALNDELLLVVVGAGASRDCLSEFYAMDESTVTVRPRAWHGSTELREQSLHSVRPPITKHLVAPDAFRNELFEAHPYAASVIDYLRKTNPVESGSAKSLEVALEAYGKRHSPGTQRNLLDFRFYLRDLLLACSDYMLSSDLEGVTNYTTLVQRCTEWAYTTGSRVCFVSFNYDTLLEQACEVEWPWFDKRKLNTYCSTETQLVLLKPHGSALWQRRLLDGQDAKGHWSLARLAAQKSVQRSDELLDEARLSEIGTLDGDIFTSGAFYLAVPHLALPIASAKEFMWPHDQARFMQSLEGQVTRLLTVGWRGAEPHFLDVLGSVVRQPLQRALICTESATAADEVEANLSSQFASAACAPPSRSIAGFRGLINPWRWRTDGVEGVADEFSDLLA